jgi:S-adenosylmethionine hydrolase
MLAKDEKPPGTILPSEAGRRPEWPDDLAEIVYVDHYGNAMTGLRASIIPASAALRANGRRIARATTFADAAPGAALWYGNSNGLAEIAINLGRADAALDLAIGTPVEVVG